ncbi:MAG: hypothetical protein ACU0E9_07690 [Limimaricola soesokkakensis]|uniref:hypothetical protein n=1 Tax=Limimaricola soesokkakensis TaxID=1343159 RepID=UPI004057FB21
MTRPKLLVIGHARHGKDTAAQLLADRLGLSWASSSEFVARKAIWPLVEDLGVWPDWRAAYADRDAHRELWFHAIAAYNCRPGPSLAAQLLDAHDIYTGMRKRAELDRSRRLFDLVIWVDRSAWLPPEPGASMELTADDADLVIDNGGDLGGLAREIERVAQVIEYVAAWHQKGPPGMAGL